MNSLKLFENRKIRSYWDADAEKWYFAIVDIIEALTGSDRPHKYWGDLKTKLKKEGSELSAKIGYERIEETQDPEKSIDRAMENYLKLGYSAA